MTDRPDRLPRPTGAPRPRPGGSPLPHARRRRALGRLFPGRTLGRLAAARSRRLRERLSEWSETRVLRPVLTLVSGTVLAQALVFGARPVLTRWFEPAAWGELTLFVTTLSVLSAVASGGYRYAVLLPRRGRDAANVVALSLLGALGTTVLTAVGVAVGIASGEVSAAWAALPAAVLLYEGGATAEAWLTRHDRFGPVSTARVSQQFVAVGVHLAAGAMGAAAGWLVGGTALGFAAAGAVAGLAAVRLGEPLRRAWRWAEIRRLARQYRRFPLFSAPAALLNLMSSRVPVFVLAAFAGPSEVGAFGIAYGALALPLGLVTGSVGQVFFVRAAEAHREASLVGLTRDVLRGLVAVTAFPALAVLAAGPTLYGFVFGPEWVEAGVYAQRLAPWILAASIASPMTALFDVLGRQRSDLAFSVVLAGGTTAALLVAGQSGSAATLVLAGSVAGATLRIAQIAWMLRMAHVPLAGPALDTLRALGTAAPLAGLVWALDASGAGGPAVLAATVGGGLIALALASRQRTSRGA